MIRASIKAHPMVIQLLKLVQSRRFTIASIVGLGGFGCWLIFLAAIGFYHGMAPADALDYMTDKPRIVRWHDESIFGLPIEGFYAWCSLLAGLAACALSIYFALQLPPSIHDSRSCNG